MSASNASILVGVWFVLALGLSLLAGRAMADSDPDILWPPQDVPSHPPAARPAAAPETRDLRPEVASFWRRVSRLVAW